MKKDQYLLIRLTKAVHMDRGCSNVPPIQMRTLTSEMKVEWGIRTHHWLLMLGLDKRESENNVRRRDWWEIRRTDATGEEEDEEKEEGEEEKEEEEGIVCVMDEIIINLSRLMRNTFGHFLKK